MTREIKDFKIPLKLSSGAYLEILIFDQPEFPDPEHRWIFRYRYVTPAEHRRGEAPDLINRVTFAVDYLDGIAGKCDLSMNMVVPERRGKNYLWGVDVSPNSVLDLNIRYKNEEGVYRAKVVEEGADVGIELDEREEGLIKPVEFPFPLEDRVEIQHGVYKFPFLLTGDEISYFKFPDKYQKS